MLNFLAANKTEGLTKVFISPLSVLESAISNKNQILPQTVRKQEKRKPIIIIIAVAAAAARDESVTCRLLYLYSSEC